MEKIGMIFAEIGSSIKVRFLEIIDSQLESTFKKANNWRSEGLSGDLNREFNLVKN